MPVDRDKVAALRIEREPEGPARRRAWPWLLLAVALSAAAVAWALARPGVPQVRVATARPAASAAGGTASVLDASGYVTARRAATISSKVTGRVTDVYVEEGMAVEEGQLLARLDSATGDRTLALAEAAAAAAASELAETRVRIEEARLDRVRAEELARQGVAAQAELDRAAAQLAALEARLVAQSDALAVSRRQVELTRQEVADLEIRAPFAGVVVAKNAQPGEMISPISAGGGFTRTGICTLVDMESLEIEVDVNEAYIDRVRTGQPVTAVLDAYPGWEIPARVIAVVPTADRQKATVRVRVAIEAPDPRILPDMGVKVAFHAAREAGGAAEPAAAAAAVPQAAVAREGERDVVFVVAGERVERRAVEVASRQGETVTVAAGLRPGERVVLAPPAGLADGAAVEVVGDEDGEQEEGR